MLILPEKEARVLVYSSSILPIIITMGMLAYLSLWLTGMVKHKDFSYFPSYLCPLNNGR